MFGQHVSQKLSAYCQSELSDEESRCVAEHLIGCQRCRRELEEVKLGIGLAEQLTPEHAPANLWNEIEHALQTEDAGRVASHPKPSSLKAAFNWRVLATACAALLLIAAIGLALLYERQQQARPQLAAIEKAQQLDDTDFNQLQTKNSAPQQVTVNIQPVLVPPQNKNSGTIRTIDNSRPSKIKTGSPNERPAWEVARLEGKPKVGASLIEGSGQLAVGEWLETDASSRALINVADIGEVNVGPNSRVQLLETRATAHRLALQRGRMQAVIDAPPRLFIVETPSAIAVDLGCAYTLEVDDAGRSRLHVTSGWVALETKGRESIVPAGAICLTEPGKGPGTPFFDDASAKFRDALARLDFENGGAEALEQVLAEAREYDTLTLWHLLSRTRAVERGRVYDRMAELIAPPVGVTREGVLRLDKKMLSLWKREMEWAWFEEKGGKAGKVGKAGIKGVKRND